MNRPRHWSVAAGQVRAAALACVTAATVLAAAGCDAPSDAAASRLYTFPGNPLFAAARLLDGNGHPVEAAELRMVAGTPSGIWAAGQPGEMAEVKKATVAATREHAVPVIVAYNLPHRDACGRFSAGPDISPQAYQDWIGQLATAIGGGPGIVIVEPDGLPDLIRGCLSRAQSAERYRLLRYAMRTLGALPQAQVYLDAGNPGMFGNPARLRRPLEAAGIRYGRGFSANVSNFGWTGTVVRWSQRLEHDLGGGAAAVVDTSRNGRGPYAGPDTPQWCNPPGRALGPAPRLNPGPAGIDAFLWVKDPGASDGPCNGGPPAGQYWPGYALRLAQARHLR